MGYSSTAQESWPDVEAPLDESRTVLVIDDEDAAGVVSKSPSVSTPLLQVEKQAIVDQRMLGMQLTADELKTVLTDLRTPTMDIIRDEGGHLLKLSLPIIGTTLLELVPDTLLTMMLGHLDPTWSTQYLAAFSLASFFRLLLVLGLFQGISAAIDTLSAQAFGGKRLRELWLFTQAGCVVYAVCLPFIAAILLNAAPLLRALGQDAAISHVAAQFLLITLVTMPFSALYVIVRSTLQAQNIVVPFVYATAISWIVGIPIGYQLGFHTSLNYMGIMSAMFISDLIRSIILLVVVLHNEVFLQAWPGWQLREAMQHVPMIAKLAASSVLMVTFQMLGNSVNSLLAGLLNNAAVMLAANSIFLTCITLAFMPLMGICISGAVRMGNALGAGNARRASIVGRVVIGACVTVATFGMMLVAWIAGPFARLMTTDPETIAIATQMTKSLLILIPLLGFMFGLQSIWRASGKQWLCAQLNFLFLVAISVPVGLLLAIQAQQGLTGLWYGQCIGCLLFLLTGCVWLYRASWTEMAQDARRNTHLEKEVMAS